MNKNMDIATQYLPILAKTRVEEVIIKAFDKYPDEPWRSMSVEEHLTHAVEHFAKHQAGDKTEPHLDHAITRVGMAIWVSEQQCGYVIGGGMSCTMVLNHSQSLAHTSAKADRR